MEFDEWSTDYTNKCGNCHTELRPGDAYCRYCGTKRGWGEFKPYRNDFACVYGPPPVERTYRCMNCRHTWKSCEMIVSELFCPKCGSQVKVEEDAEGQVKGSNSLGDILRSFFKK